MLGSGENLLLDRVDRHQAENAKFVLLTDSMGAVLGLKGRENTDMNAGLGPGNGDEGKYGIDQWR